MTPTTCRNFDLLFTSACTRYKAIVVDAPAETVRLRFELRKVNQ